MLKIFRLLAAGLLLLALATSGAGIFLTWFGSRDLPEGIDRIRIDENGEEEQFAGEFEGFTTSTLETGILSSSYEIRDGRRVAVLADDIAYISYNFENGLPNARANITIVPRYFVTDFASIPWPASYLISPFGDHAEAAVVHDWLYALGPNAEKGSPDYEKEWEEARKHADLVFYKAMRESGVPKWRRRIMFGAVRFGGRSFGNGVDWFGKECPEGLTECSNIDVSRFYEPYVGVSIPINCLPERNASDYTFLIGTVSRADGVRILDQESDTSTDIGKYIDGVWRNAFSSETCSKFIADVVLEERPFVAVRSPNIVGVEGPPMVALRTELNSMVISEIVKYSFIPPELPQFVYEEMENLFGYTDISPVLQSNDQLRRLKQSRALLDSMEGVDASHVSELMNIYEEIERRGDQILALVPDSGLSAGNITAPSVSRLLDFARSYAEDSRAADKTLAEVEDRYFDNPIVQKVYTERRKEDLNSRFEASSNILPEIE